MRGTGGATRPGERAGGHAAGAGNPLTGLQVFRASRLEALVPPLWELLGHTWPEDILAPQTVIAAHPGMKHWLLGALARDRGTDGIAANLEVMLPSTWLDGLAAARLGTHATALPRYRRQVLRWTLHGMLAADGALATSAGALIASYLGPDADGGAGELARRRFQLADRLARVYSQYVVYRPDWLAAWESGQFGYVTASNPALAPMEAQLLGPLWRELVAQLGSHRGQVIARLHASLVDDPAPRPALHVFGLSHLAPAELALLRAYARTGLVTLYVPDPCREFWGGLVRGVPVQTALRQPDADAWQAWRGEEDQRLAEAGDGDYWHEQDHPLLARWGRLGQHFFSALAEGEVREDIRHWQDEQSTAPGNRLERVQESIRRLDPALMRPAATAEDTLADPSLRIHACHTRQRELEVLRDQLLDAFAAGIAPGEMVVMAPDIREYLPLIPAVFGEPGSTRERRLPYHLADVPVARGHALFATWQTLLDLPGQRITAPQVLDLLGVAAIRHRLGLDEAEVDLLAEWLRQSRVAWSLDPAHRESFGVPAVAEHGFAWAMDRMLAGYLMSDAPEADRERAFVLPDGTGLVPVTGISGPSAQALGALDRLLQELQAWSSLGHRALPASAWVDELHARLDALFRVDAADPGARDALDAIGQIIAGLAEEPAQAGEDPVLHFQVVRDLLLERLQSVPDRQRFLMGGVTFCGMVPQRAIPFRMVAVLGLNEGEFPRNSTDGGLDLMARIRRIGDRDVRNDDRYLFLETLMSTRDRLHLGYIGERVSDGKPRNPAAPLAELMAELDRAAGLEHDADDAARPWLVRHPLQPFDGRYFSGADARLFSYARQFARMQGSGRAPDRPFRGEPAGAPDPLPDPLALPELTGYYRDPARRLLERRLKLRLDALDEDRLREDEPLEPRLGAIESVARRVFFSQVLPAWPEGEWRPGQAPGWVRLSGMLPTGEPGRTAWLDELESINALLQAARDGGTLDAASAAAGGQQAVDVVLEGGCRITGRIHHVFPLAGAAPGLQLVRAYPARAGLKQPGQLHFGERITLFLEWAMLRLHGGVATGPRQPVRVLPLLSDAEDFGINGWDARFVQADAEQAAGMRADLARRVAALVGFWHEAQRRPPLYFPRLAAAALREMDKSGGRGSLEETAGLVDGGRLLKAWDDHDGRGERNYAPGYNALLAGEAGFGAPSPELVELLGHAHRLAAWIDLDLPPGGAP